MKVIVKNQFEDNEINTKTKHTFLLKRMQPNYDRKINYRCDCNIEINKKHKENCIYNLV